MAATVANTFDKLSNVKGEVLNNSLAYSPPEKKAKTLGETMGNVKARRLFDMLPDNLREANAEINLAH